MGSRGYLIWLLATARQTVKYDNTTNLPLGLLAYTETLL
jgi:hypothetical protein